MSSLANAILFLALVTTAVMVAVMYRKLMTAQNAVASFGAEGKETLVLLSQRIEEAQAIATRLEHLTQEARLQRQSYSGTSHS